MTVLKNWCLFFWYWKICDSSWKITTLIKIGIEGKKIYRALKFIQSQYLEFKTLKRIETKKNGGKDGKAL